ncbi:MAG: hypothetical protein A3J55_01110 [Candidatus Ryanbacteria bacterium RIFCSPHIGHO2_02_FULL_45_17b]|uniref:Uncharacterized protein n=1 Tax=Candidatus Ryanbacteria bacterium RIFCSPHIGHO2_01_FULL_45_22 TaxID=1802114 RepID=A0A1G2G113_9BACT|nr:MAG: hypothetical protein A2719_03580 [Candidatus Ryanbacteria bacterium RIFCSPHIGHO2_01_FULL_45_22]OGZ47136.1 MAG: hypothetical protein A3J55_01110 [Candidatus Ryanbacteria bacterium RIFCSPHIGHO2_02_FULL_45_17b]
MENELFQTIKEQGAKLDAIWKSVEKTRKYFLVIIWVTVILFVLPLAGLVFIIPQFLDVYLGSFNGLL